MQNHKICMWIKWKIQFVDIFLWKLNFLKKKLVKSCFEITIVYQLLLRIYFNHLASLRKTVILSRKIQFKKKLYKIMTVKKPGRVGTKLKRLSNRSSVLSRSLSSLASYATWVVPNHIDMPERAHWSRIFFAYQR